MEEAADLYSRNKLATSDEHAMKIWLPVADLNMYLTVDVLTQLKIKQHNDTLVLHGLV